MEEDRDVQKEDVAPEEIVEEVETTSEEVNPTDQGDDQVRDVEEIDDRGVPLKNKVKEFERKLEKSQREAESLRQRLMELEQPKKETPEVDELDQLKAELKKGGYTEDSIDIVAKVAEKIADKKLKMFQQSVEPMMHDSNYFKRKSVLSNMIENDRTGKLKMYESEINEALDRMSPDVWRNETAINYVAKSIVFDGDSKKSLESKEKTKVATKKVSESSPASPAKKSIEASNEIEDYGISHGLDASNPEIRKKISNILSIKKRMKKI